MTYNPEKQMIELEQNEGLGFCPALVMKYALMIHNKINNKDFEIL